jgi:hypothetical protein
MLTIQPYSIAAQRQTHYSQNSKIDRTTARNVQFKGGFLAPEAVAKLKIGDILPELNATAQQDYKAAAELVAKIKSHLESYIPNANSLIRKNSSGLAVRIEDSDDTLIQSISFHKDYKSIEKLESKNGDLEFDKDGMLKKFIQARRYVSFDTNGALTQVEQALNSCDYATHLKRWSYHPNGQLKEDFHYYSGEFSRKNTYDRFGNLISSVET